MIIKTKFGNARKLPNGRYQICSRKEGNHGKYLHRLIYENFYGVSLLDYVNIHHKDGNFKNNCILNLEPMLWGEHSKLHNKGTHKSKKTRMKISESQNSSGYFRVIKHIDKKCEQGYDWRYQYYDDNFKLKTISSVDLNKLKTKVIEKGLEWEELDNK